MKITFDTDKLSQEGAINILHMLVQKFNFLIRDLDFEKDHEVVKIYFDEGSADIIFESVDTCYVEEETKAE